jgi:mono/diheme cytochrome c family protein
MLIGVKLNFLRSVFCESFTKFMKTAKLFLIAFVTAISLLSACSQLKPVAKDVTPTVNNTPDDNHSSPAAGNKTPAPIGSLAQSTTTLSGAGDGVELYTAKCMICHKDNGTGGKVTIEGKTLKPADLTTAKMKSRADDKLAQMISEGAPEDGMPAFKGKLSDDQIKSVVQYIRTLQ